MREGVRVANHNEGVPRSRKQYIETLRRIHEPNVIGGITTAKGGDDNIALFTLIVVWHGGW